MSDLISRQAAIDAVCSVCGVDCDKSKFVYGGKQEDQVILCPEHYALTQLPSAQPYTDAEIQKIQDLEQAELQKAYECGRASAQPESRWIPCSERLPEEGKEVFVTCGHGRFAYTAEGKYANRFGGWVSAWDNGDLPNVLRGCQSLNRGEVMRND